MKKYQGIRLALLAAVLAASGVNGVALAIDEKEQNHPIGSAQKLSITGDPLVGTGGVTVTNGFIDSRKNPDGITYTLDADFYSFYGKEDDTVTIRIEGGIKQSGMADRVNTVLTLFKPGADYVVKDWIDDLPPPGPITRFDARLDNVKLDKTGIWTVGVTASPARLVNGGIFSFLGRASDPPMGALSRGSYTLIISGVSLPTMQINIEVKPGSGETAPINPKSKGNIPVALLSSAKFDALNVKVDAKTLTFGATGDEPSLLRCNKDGVDVNGDGRLDLLCHFENQQTHFTPDHARGTLKGLTMDGTAFEGRANLKVVPVKREVD